MNEIKDIKITKGMTVKKLTEQLAESGFQAQHLGEAIAILKEAKQNKATTFLSFTSNMAASGLRGIFIDLVKNRKIDVIVTSSGTIDEDLIRAKRPYLKGSFEADDAKLGKEGINRMGNIYVPNDRYEYLDDLSQELLSKIYEKHKELTPSELIKEMGLLLETEDSLVYWAARNDIPIFCPGISDGSFGMQLMFFHQKHPDFRIDVLKDFNKIIGIAMGAEKTCGIVLGGGIAKHHTIISNLMNEGFDYAIYVNSSTPYHGSLSSATTSEAKSWGKVKPDAHAITVYGDAAILFPLLIASVDEVLDEG